MKHFLVFAVALSLFAPLASAINPAVKDSEWDPLGQTCDPVGLCTFTRTDTLPGNIPVEVNVVSLGAYKDAADKVLDYVFSKAKETAKALDQNDPVSSVALANAGAGTTKVAVAPELIKILGLAKKVWMWTNGAYDIIKSQEKWNVKHVRVKEKSSSIFLKKRGMVLKLDDILHGYLADLMIREIYNANIDNASVTVGPATKTIGLGVHGAWRTTISTEKLGEYAEYGMTIDISNASVASVTAGVNAPTTDPRTKSQFSPRCKGVTVLARDAATAEALASGIYVLGPEEGMALVNKLGTIRAIIFTSDGEMVKSEGL